MKLGLFGGRLRINILIFPVAIFMCYLSGMISAVAFFIALVLHECAHAVVASAVGVKVWSLEVLPFGCTAKMESFAVVSGGKEIVMAAAGPAVNIISAAAVYVIFKHNAGEFASAFMRSSMMLASINLIPALPLDGGRIVASIIGMKYSAFVATRITSVMGMIASAVILAVGFFLAANSAVNPTLFIMGGFMLYSSIGHFKNAAFAFMKHNTIKRDEMVKRKSIDVKSIAAHRERSVGEVLTSLDRRKYNIVYVLDDNLNVVKRIDEANIMDGMLKEGLTKKLEEI